MGASADIGRTDTATALRGAREAVWKAVDGLLDSCADLPRLEGHRLELLALERWRKLGRPVPASVLDRARLAAATSLAANALLGRIRAACEGPLLVFKGPEVAARYRDPSLRLYGDLDLVVEDAERSHAELLAAGFREVGDPSLYVDIHHLRPLAFGRHPLVVELHTQPKWVEGLQAPPVGALLAAAVPSATGVPGILAPSPAHHALILAAHSWAHEPLRRLRDLVEIAAVASEAEPAEVARVARTWGAERLWETTTRAVDAVLAGGRPPWPLRTWARDLVELRGRTVLEGHLDRWLSDFAVLPPATAVRRLPSTLWAEITPENDEGWRRKLARVRLAFRNASVARAEHDRQLAD